MFSFKQNEGVIPTSEGVIPTSEGCILTSEGVILTKQAFFGRFFARTNTLNPENRDKTPDLPIKTTCFGNFYDIYSYPTDIPTPREVFLCIWIMNLGAKIGRGHLREVTTFAPVLLVYSFTLHIQHRNRT
jgi:hypothetical protein